MHVRKQGLVTLPKVIKNGKSPIYEYVWLANMEFGGMVSFVMLHFALLSSCPHINATPLDVSQVPSALVQLLLRSFMFFPADLLLRTAEKKARGAQAESTDARSFTSLLEGGDVEAMGKADAQVGKGSNGRHTDLEAVVRGLRKELRGKDERLKEKDERLREKDEKLREKDETVREKDEEITQLKIKLQGILNNKNEAVSAEL